MKPKPQFHVHVILLSLLLLGQHCARAATLNGKLVDVDGNGIPNQPMQLCVNNQACVSTTTGAEGHYSFDVSPGSYYFVIGWGVNWTPINAPFEYYVVSAPFEVTEDTVRDVRLPAYRVSVHVQDVNERPVAGVQMGGGEQGVWTQGLDLGGGLTGWGCSEYPDFATRAAVTDETGNTTLWLFPRPADRPSYTLMAKPPANSGLAATTLNVEITGNMDLTITLPNAVRVEGRLVDDFGNGIPNQPMQLCVNNQARFSTTTGAEGHYSFDVSPGSYYFVIGWGVNWTPINAPFEYYVVSAPFEVTEDTVRDVRLPAYRVSVHVQDVNGRPVAGVQMGGGEQGVWTQGLDLGGGLTGWGCSEYPDFATRAAVTDETGNTTLWLFPRPADRPSYTLMAKPPANSGLAATTLNAEITGNMDLTFTLEMLHDPPVTSAIVAGTDGGGGVHLGPATITLSASAISGFDVVATYYTIDGSQPAVYLEPFTVSEIGDHTVGYWSIDTAGVYEAPKALSLTIAGGPPVIFGLDPASARTGADVDLAVVGSGFAPGAKVLWNGTAREDTKRISAAELQVKILAPEIETGLPINVFTVEVLNPNDEVSNPVAFTVICGTVAEVDSQLVQPGVSAEVSTLPTVEGQAGVAATLRAAEDGDARTVTSAVYSSNPASGTFFDVGGGFVDLQVRGAEPDDSLAALFYYPLTITGTVEDNLVLLHYDGSAWVPTLGIGGAQPVKSTVDRLDGTASGGRFTVTFGATSTPTITELNGTVFAATTPFVFTGFLPPVGGADESGGSFEEPLRTFRLNSTIPVKFSAALNGAPVLDGIHRLQVVKYYDKRSSDDPIDATASDQATIRDQFRLVDGEWHFNLDTRATGMSAGVWQLRALLSDGSRHSAWIQLR